MASDALSLEPVKCKAHSLAYLLTHDMGENCPVFLDTSAAIDMEQDLSLERTRHRSFAPVNFYFYLRDRIPGGIFVTNEIAAEAVQHTRHKVHGRPEISEETANIMLLFNESYRRFLENHSFSSPVDDIRHDVYWASKIAFDPEHKKSSWDPISRNDLQLLTAALHARHAEYVTGSTIFSSDTHITETARVLTNQHESAYANLCKMIRIDPIDHAPEVNGYQPFNYNGLRAFSTRSEDHVFAI